ncbi:DUF5682 family protein [Serratia fonticola]|uniref:DUF5682 family protein n=1 Tax=Serratia fonticola TaxID=47917 RepID=UPI0014153CEC|nr:DUF5682 family protein [Serratia fonticola]NXZ86967.1 hypothetical protein [Serratia fonticola]QIP94344.1 hypothetical protein HAP32_04864 [Serratia fonticola]
MNKSPEIIGIRHHSPACARLVAARINTLKPRYVLIEGPMDFNSRLDELFLPHQLPLAIYSYGVPQQPGQGVRRGSWSPFAEHSPEWQALQQARAIKAEIRFMDLPAWHAAFADIANRYADLADAEQQQRAEDFEQALSQELGIQGSDALWDRLFEDQCDVRELEQRLSHYFERLRGEVPGSQGNQDREAMMARWIRWAMDQRDGAVLVVCGGYHAPPLMKLWQNLPSEEHEPELPAISQCFDDWQGDTQYTTGSYLVPYSYKRLDAFTGYASGMPSPAFQQWVWEFGLEQAGLYAFQRILERLRKLNLPASTADMGAVYLRVQALARLRGHQLPLRNDWLDAMAGSLVKEAMDVPLPWTYRGPLRPGTEPILVQMMAVLAGESHGKLAANTPRPPLLISLELELERLAITIPSEVKLDLLKPEDRQRSRALHQLSLLAIPGIHCLKGVGQAMSGEMSEHWQLRAPLEQVAALIEAASYGATLADAALAKLEEALLELHGSQGMVVALVKLLNQAALAGLADFSSRVVEQLTAAVSQEGSFEDLGFALEAAHTLYRHGESVGMQGSAILLTVIQITFDRALWLCESYGSVNPADSHRHIAAFQAIRLVTRDLLALPDADRNTLFPALEADRALTVWQRKAASTDADPLSRGAALGALLSLNDTQPDTASVMTQPLALLATLAANKMGDALSGLIALARHQLTQDLTFVDGLNQLVTALDDEDFLLALPAMRGAFAWLPPRERGEFARQILELHQAGHLPVSSLNREITAATPQEIAAMQQAEKRALEILGQWGLV